MALKIIGHRGNGRTTETPFLEGKAPQSTLKSFTQAMVDNQADGVEFDVFVSADGVPIVIERDEIEGFKVSDLSYENILSLNLAPDSSHPSLEQALKHFHELSNTLEKKFVLNLELKGRSVVRSTLDTVDKLEEEIGFDRSQIRYSSFDRDKLANVRARDDAAIIQPTIATMQLFKGKDISMPGYAVSPTADYNKAALADLSSFMTEFNCAAIDTPTCDIRPELIDFAAKHNAGFCSHPSGPRRFSYAHVLDDSLRLLAEYSKEQDVIVKVDDIPLTQEYFKRVMGDSDGRDHKESSEVLERIMGIPFIR